jgi:hypothetical protein
MYTTARNLPPAYTTDNNPHFKAVATVQVFLKIITTSDSYPLLKTQSQHSQICSLKN